jgi:hypothetical protein
MLGSQGLRRFVLLGVASVGVSIAAVQGCASGEVEFEDDGATSVSTTSQGQGGGAGSGSGAGGGIGGSAGSQNLPCGMDCSNINAPPCLQSVCNEGQYQGPIGQCVVVPSDAGEACDDGLFCTIDDACDGNGLCMGGPANDCGMAPAACNEVTCNEASQSCSQAPSMNGAPCQDPNNLCLKGSTCNNGLCIGGTIDDCFFFPVPDDCHVAVCNPMTGMCEPQVGNEGMACIDSTDLCTVNKTCANGVCQGGSPKDCSGLSVGCNVGVCDTASGLCTTMMVQNGQPCDDLNPCTTGELCNNGNCAGGSPVTQCVANDGCCPMNCNQSNDADCGCSVNHALTAVGSSSGGGSGGFGPAAWNNGVTGTQCQTMFGCSMCFGWVSNSTTANGAWVQYDWTAPVTIGSMWLDANSCTGLCYSGGRTVNSGTVQWWNGSAWINAQTFTNQNNAFGVTFIPPLITTKLRIFDITAGSCGQTSNSLIYEWYVYPGANCSPPP